MNGTGSSRTPVSPVTATYRPATYGSHRRSSEIRVRTPRPDGGCHQCWTSPAWNCRAAARSRCSRASPRWEMDEREDVLELVPEAVGATRLVERRARPQPAGQGLVEQPAVEQDVHRSVRGPDPDRPQGGVPVGSDRSQRGAVVEVATAPDELARGVRVGGLTEQDTHRGPLAGGELEAARQRGARIHARAGRAREAVAAVERGRSVVGTVPPEHLGPIGGPCVLPATEIQERDPIGEVGVPRIARQERVRRRLEIGHDRRRRGPPGGAQDPLGIGRHRQAPPPAGLVLDASGRRS